MIILDTDALTLTQMRSRSEPGSLLVRRLDARAGPDGAFVTIVRSISASRRSRWRRMRC